MEYETSNRKVGKSGKAAPSVRRNYKQREPLTYTDSTAEIVNGMVEICTKNGGAVMFGLTSDGGAYAVHVFQGSDRIKEYPTSAEELSDLYMWLRDVFYGM